MPKSSVATEPVSGPNHDTVASDTPVDPTTAPEVGDGARSAKVCVTLLLKPDPVAHSVEADTASMACSVAAWIGVGSGTSSQPVPSKWRMSGPIPTPTAYTLRALSARTPNSSWPSAD